MEQYDKIAQQYDRANEERPDRARILTPSAKRYLGNIAGLDVLDLACGSGYFTRLMRLWGARIVVGVDVSEGMIKLAREREKMDPLGIDYRVGEVSTLEALGEFDVVFAGFLLHYASSVMTLRAMCLAVARNLKKGGRFVAFNENPAHPIHEGRKYEVEMRALDPIRDEARIEFTHFRDGAPALTVSHRHYEPATYRGALEAAGFSSIEWKPFIKGVDADAGLPSGYWNDFLRDDFSVAVLLCDKVK